MRFERLRSRFSSAHAIALLALFVALGGSAYALKLPRNTVGSKQIKPNAVKGVDAKESSFGEVPSATNADNAANAAKLGGLASSAFQPTGAVVGGSGDPTVVSQTMLTIPDLGLQIETNGAATGTNDVIARNVGSQSLSFVSGDDAGDENTISPSGTFGLFAGVSEFGGATASFELLVLGTNHASVLKCYFPEAPGTIDFCQATTASK